MYALTVKFLVIILWFIRDNPQAVDGDKNRPTVFHCRLFVLFTHMPTYLTDLLTWAAHSGMELNISKTKEMILGQLAVTNLPLLSISSQTTDRVTSLKLLEVHTDSSLSWYIHIDHIVRRQLPGYISKELVCLVVTYLIST